MLCPEVLIQFRAGIEPLFGELSNRSRRCEQKLARFVYEKFLSMEARELKGKQMEGGWKRGESGAGIENSGHYKCPSGSEIAQYLEHPVRFRRLFDSIAE